MYMYCKYYKGLVINFKKIDKTAKLVLLLVYMQKFCQKMISDQQNWHMTMILPTDQSHWPVLALMSYTKREDFHRECYGRTCCCEKLRGFISEGWDKRCLVFELHCSCHSDYEKGKRGIVMRNKFGSQFQMKIII